MDTVIYIDILCPALLCVCVCVRLHDFANISVRLLIVHTVLLIRLLLSNTVEFSWVLHIFVVLSTVKIRKVFTYAVNPHCATPTPITAHLPRVLWCLVPPGLLKSPLTLVLVPHLPLPTHHPSQWAGPRAATPHPPPLTTVHNLPERTP